MRWNREGLKGERWPVTRRRLPGQIISDEVLLIADGDVGSRLTAALEQECFQVHLAHALAAALILMVDQPVSLLIVDSSLESFPLDLFLFARNRLKPELARKTIFLSSYESDPARADLVDGDPGMKLWRDTEIDELLHCARAITRGEADSER